MPSLNSKLGIATVPSQSLLFRESYFVPIPNAIPLAQGSAVLLFECGRIKPQIIRGFDWFFAGMPRA